MLNSGKIRLLDSDTLINQFTGLERRPSAGGLDRVDHAANGNVDMCNSVAGVPTLPMHAADPQARVL